MTPDFLDLGSNPPSASPTSYAAPLVQDVDPGAFIFTLPNSIPSDAEGARLPITIENGIVLVGSDAHYWPEDRTSIPAAHRAFVRMCTELAPAVVILNGDIVDGARTSRWDAAHWADYTSRPTVVDELGVCQKRLREIANATPETARRIWTLGNHDSRFERYLIAGAPEAVGVHGTRLKDHFDEWEPAMSVMFNEHRGNRGVFVKHRYMGGKHAPYNNTLFGGMTVVTGHLHSQKVEPHSDLCGTRWGVDSGMLGAPYGLSSLYAEDNPVDWRSGFAVLTFRDGLLLPPELVTVLNERAGLVSWRGELLGV